MTTDNNANAFASTFLFFATHNATAEKNKKELTSQRTTTERNGQTHHDRKKQRTANTNAALKLLNKYFPK